MFDFVSNNSHTVNTSKIIRVDWNNVDKNNGDKYVEYVLIRFVDNQAMHLYFDEPEDFVLINLLRFFFNQKRFVLDSTNRKFS